MSIGRKLVVVAGLILTAAVLVADEASDSDEIMRQKLESIQQEIAALRQEASRLSAQENSILSQVSQFDVQVQMKTHEIELLTLRQQKTESDIQKLQDQ